MPFDPRDLTSAPSRGDAFEFDFEGSLIKAHAGESIAEALLAAGICRLSRSPKYHRPRGAFCFAGQCGTCLVRVNGRPNVMSCLEPAYQHTRCERQNAFPDGDLDVLRASDWLFPSGMDHHHLMTGTKVGNAMFVKLVRQMGGTGTLPDAPDTRFGETTQADFDVCVVGAGPAGLAVATHIVQQHSSARVLVIDRRKGLGGSWLAEPDGAAHVASTHRTLANGNVDCWLGSSVLGHYPEDDFDVQPAHADVVPGVLAVLRPTHIALVRARRFVFATGAYEQNLAFPSNDAPGVIAARALGHLAFSRGILPTRKVKLLCDSEHAFAYADRLQAGLERLGAQVQRVEHNADADTAVGRKTTLAVATLPAPAFELPRHFGIATTMRPHAGGFAIDAAADGTTPVPGVFVAGDVTGYMGPQKAETHGQAVGLAVGHSLSSRV